MNIIDKQTAEIKKIEENLLKVSETIRILKKENLEEQVEKRKLLTVSLKEAKLKLETYRKEALLEKLEKDLKVKCVDDLGRLLGQSGRV